MSAIPPKTSIEGLARSAEDLLQSAFNRGVKYGRYLEQQERLNKIPKWASVEYNPPDGTKDVIAYNAYGEMMIGRICATATGYKCEDGYSEDMLRVTHWMPKPDDPKEECR